MTVFSLWRASAVQDKARNAARKRNRTRDGANERVGFTGLRLLIRLRLAGHFEDRVTLQPLVRFKTLALDMFGRRGDVDEGGSVHFLCRVAPVELLGFQGRSAIGDHDNVVVRLEIVRKIVHLSALRREDGSVPLVLVVEIDRYVGVKAGESPVGKHRDMTGTEDPRDPA